MHPLSTFPALLTYDFFSFTLLRLAVSAFIIYLGVKRYHKEYKWAFIAYLIFGVLILLGLYTQISAIVAIIALKFDFYVDYYKNRNITPISKEIYFLYGIAGIILFALLFTGPGAFAFDLPL